MEAVVESTLDEILAAQITVASAREQVNPQRPNWWTTDLVDPEGGGDLFRRLLPRTGAWDTLASVREFARRVDTLGRQQLGEADQIRSLFSLEFELDERPDERLRDLKRARDASDALSWPVSFVRYALPDLRAAFRHGPNGAPEYTFILGGWQFGSCSLRGDRPKQTPEEPEDVMPEVVHALIEREVEVEAPLAESTKGAWR